MWGMEMALLTGLQRAPGGSSARRRQKGRASGLQRKESSSRAHSTVPRTRVGVDFRRAYKVRIGLGRVKWKIA